MNDLIMNYANADLNKIDVINNPVVLKQMMISL